MNKLIKLVLIVSLGLISSHAFAFFDSFFKTWQPPANYQELFQEYFQRALQFPILMYEPFTDAEGHLQYMSKIEKHEVKHQRKALEMLINQGADLKSLMANIYPEYPNTNLFFLYAHKDLLLDHLGLANFLKLVLEGKILFPMYESRIDENCLRLQSELLQFALEGNVDLDQFLGTCIGYHTNIRVLDLNKELLLEKLGASNFLMLVLYVDEIFPGTEALKLELIQRAIEEGADLAFEGDSLSICSCAEEYKNEQYHEVGLAHMLDNPKFVFEKKYKNLNAQKEDEPKMPYITHHIWLTHHSSPKEIMDVDIANLITTKKVFDRAPVKWKHIVWCNDPQLIVIRLPNLKKLESELDRFIGIEKA